MPDPNNPGKITEYPHPHFISFEITKKCNFTCVYCYASRENTKREPDMTMEEIREHVIPQLHDMKPRTFGFFGGEPFMRFDDMLALAPDMDKVPGIKDMCVSTNGYFVTEQNLKEFKQAYKHFPFHLMSVSIDSFDPITFKKTRPPKDDALERAMHAVDLALAQKYYVTVQTVATRLNFHELPALMNHVNKKGWRCLIEIFPMMRSGRGHAHAQDDLALTPDQMRELDRLRIQNHGKTILMWDNMPCPWDEKAYKRHSTGAFCTSSGCSAGNNSLNIDHAGHVYPCTYLDDVILGNVKEGPHALLDIWQTNEIIARLRKREFSGKCGVCKHNSVCGGCRARARAESGDLFGSVESCEGGPDGHPLEREATRIFNWETEKFKLFEAFNAFYYRLVRNKKY